MARQIPLPLPSQSGGGGLPRPPKEAKPVSRAIWSRSTNQQRVTAALKELGYRMAEQQRAGENVLVRPPDAGTVVVGANLVSVYSGGMITERSRIRQTSTDSLAASLCELGDFDDFISTVQRRLGTTA